MHYTGIRQSDSSSFIVKLELFHKKNQIVPDLIDFTRRDSYPCIRKVLQIRWCPELFPYPISPAHLNAYFAIITAIISLIMAAATIVPDTIAASDESTVLFLITGLIITDR